MESDQIFTSNSIRKKNLSEEKRKSIYEFLLKQSNGGIIKKGIFCYTSNHFSICTRTVRRIWQRAQQHASDGTPIDISSRMRGRVGRKHITPDLSRLSEIPWSSRSNIRSLAAAMHMKKSTVHNLVKEGLIKAHTNAIKPSLNDENKRKRLEFCLSMIDPPTLYTNPRFRDMYNVVYIDEKWFFMSRTSERYYMLPNENEPLRTYKNKKFITKVMFLAAVARPRFDQFGNEGFSGKIGIFPFIFKEPAKRKSKNRPAGTMETKPILSITKDVTRSCLIENVLPAIRSKWPRNALGTIYIQQDNAKPHIHINDDLFLEEGTRDGFDIRIFCQPPNSPDMNVLDLGFFRAIQSLQHQQAPKTINELIEAVEKSFWEYPSQCLNRVFLSLQACMIEVMKVKGGIDYKVPHMAKNSLENANNLPIQIGCDAMLVKDAIEHLSNPQNRSQNAVEDSP